MEQVIVFANTHSALVAQKELQGVCAYVVMPTPRHISASCGIALKIAREDVEQAKAVLEKTVPGTFTVHEMMG